MELSRFKEQLDDVSARWPWLADHMERVGMFAYALGREYEVSRMDLERLYMAGLLHGLGEHQLRVFKLYADADEETLTAVQRAWPVIASAAIATEPEFGYVARIVGQCAENFDGSGEPFGAEHMQVHVYAAMVRIADVYDHLRLDGLSHDAAAAELRRLSNKVVPKKLITPFLKNVVSDDDLQFDYADIRRRRAEDEARLAAEMAVAKDEEEGVDE